MSVKTRVEALERASGGDEKPWVTLHDLGDGRFSRSTPWRGCGMGGDSEVLVAADVEELRKTHRVIVIRWGGQGDGGAVGDNVIRLRWPEDLAGE